MGVTALLVLIWAGIGDTSFDKIKKCCPQGQSLAENYTCLESGHQWYYMDFDFGFPNCNFLMVTVNESDVVSCIDNSYTTGSIVALKCIADPFRFEAPDVHYVRKCCSIDRSYDAVQQTCWGTSAVEPRAPKEFFNVIMSGVRGIVDIRVGAPECGKNEVLADYLVHFNRVRREESESIVFQQYSGRPKIFNPDEVCMDLTERHEILVIRACQPSELVCRPNGKLTCLWKCCGDGEAYTIHSDHDAQCGPTDRPMEPLKFFNVSSKRPIASETATPAYFHNGPCKDKYYIVPSVDPPYYIGIDGTLYQPNDLPQRRRDFCVEDVSNHSALDGVYVFKCFEDYDTDLKAPTKVFRYSMLISAVFLLLTLIVYSCLPTLRNLHGKALMCYISSLLCAYTTYSIIYHWSPTYSDPDGEATYFLICKALGFLLHFAFAATFFWLNVISFDIWWTFGTIRPKLGRQAGDKKRLVAYNIFAWGSGAVLTLTAILSQATDWFPLEARADIGITTCWYEKETLAIYLYFVGPSSISQACNIVFFVLTAHHCVKVRNELQRIVHTNADEHRLKADTKKFIMTVKLFVVMGISWVMENVSYLDYNGETHIFFTSDLINALQGIFIFGIFILKKKVLKAFARKVKEVLGLAEPRRHRPSTTSSSVFTVMSNTTKFAPSMGRPPPLRKCCSDSRLSIACKPLQGKTAQKNYKRAFSTTSNNFLSVIHDYRSKPG